MPEELNRYFDECKSRIDKIFAEPERYGYEGNFLDKERGAKWEDFTPAHQATLMDRFAFVYALNIDEIHKQKADNQKFDVVAYVAEKSVPLEQVGIGDVEKNLFTDKLMSRDGFILEMPGCSAMVTRAEIENRKEIFEAMGVDPGIKLRNKEGHSTYNQVVARVDDKDVIVKDIMAGALQGVHRTKGKKDQVTLMKDSISEAIAIEVKKEEEKAGSADQEKLSRFRDNLKELEGQTDTQRLDAGSLFFVAKENAVKGSDIVGARVLDAGREIHRANVSDSSPEFKGFAAGVSGNAMHYALSGLEFSRQVLGKEMTESEKEAMYKVVEKHVVGTDQAPLHHSTPETKLGEELGKVFADVAKTGKLLTESELNKAISDARVVTASYVAEVKDRLPTRERNDAARKIQAAFRGHTVRSADRSSDPGSVSGSASPGASSGRGSPEASRLVKQIEAATAKTVSAPTAAAGRSVSDLGKGSER